MRKPFVHVCVVLCLLVAAGSAAAESIKGRIGVTGRVGMHVPSDSRSSLLYQDLETDIGFRGGGGLIFGITDNLALEFDVTHYWFDAEFVSIKVQEFATTDISLGVQYRFNSPSLGPLVPYVGGGVDVLLSDTTNRYGENGDVDTVPGVHANGGVDYFITRQLAVNADLKVVAAPEADVKFRGVKMGDYDPTSFSATVGFRFFFN